MFEKWKKRQEQAQKNAEQIARITIILDGEIVSNLKGNHLLDQIKVFKEASASNLYGSILKLTNDKKQTLVDAVKLYEEDLWVIDKAENWESDSEDFGFDTTSDTDSWLTIFSIYQQLLWYYLRILYYIWLI